MARCNCSGNSCSCLIVAGAGVRVTGFGTASQPYEIAANPYTSDLGAAPTYQLRTPTGADVESFFLMTASTATIAVDLPGASPFDVMPPPGSRITALVDRGSAITGITWSSNITWFGTGPTSDHRGLYVFLQIPGGLQWAGTWTPRR